MADADVDKIVAEIDDLLARYRQPVLDADNIRAIPLGERRALVSSWASAIEGLSGPNPVYRDIAQEAINKTGVASPPTVIQVFGALAALRADYKDGYLRGVEELVHADVFADFLEMADELLKKGYKDAAAVIVGSVLEEHIRKLADRNGVATTVDGIPKKADTLNADLVKKTVYNKLEQKNVTAWLGLRNDAAHGHYDNYDQQQVGLMLQQVQAFLTRNPA
jgi:hypothetical protein